MLVSGHLSTWARTWAATGAVECITVAASIYFRPTAIVEYLPGSDPLWAVAFFAIGGGFLGIAAIFHAARRFGIFCFLIAATAHTMYGIGAFTYAVTAHESWILTSTMFQIAVLNVLAAWKIAGAGH